LAALKDRDIDLSDMPEIADWPGAVVGKFYRPIKKPVTVRLDADVIAWLKKQGKGYQTRIKRAAAGRDDESGATETGVRDSARSWLVRA